MTDDPTLDRLIAVGPRFARSVALARDAGRRDALDGYILTPTGRDVLGRLADALRGETPTRAWSLTGPYGSGKSACALFAAQLLAGDDGVRAAARKFLAGADPGLADRLFGPGGPLPKRAGRLCPVLVTGSRQPIEQALAAALAASLRAVAQRGRPPLVVDRLERLAVGTAPAGTTLVGLFEEAGDYLDRFGIEAAGFLLVIDELGKFLEYGAVHPESGDVFALQELAEAATRHRRPFLVLTILHQALDRYAEHLSAGRRAEWAKVQGRFEDVAFEERGEQVLRLLAGAVRSAGPEAAGRALRARGAALAREAFAVGVRAGSLAPAELQACLTACYPLHPLTAVLLGPLFRQIAQNERSLFAFLGAPEPFGFQDFLRGHTAADGPYRPDHLYDYVLASLGPVLFAQHRGKRWAEVQSALDRLPEAGPLEVRLAKTIGLLQALGPAAGVPASAGMLQLALKETATDTEIDSALESLVRRSVVVFRRHTGGYALWEGSDVDLDDRVRAARRAIETEQDLAAILTRQVPPRPRVARRHYFRTGTLRYFAAAYGGRADFQAGLFQTGVAGGDGRADGRVLFCLPRDPTDREEMRELVRSASVDEPVVAALPRDVAALRELTLELVGLRWVADHTPELEADRTARRELHARLAVAEQNLRTHLDWLFSPANEDCAWYARGAEVALATPRQFNDLLSRVCDEVYPSTPRWRNELINRRALSSAAAARRDLIEVMFDHPDQEALGLEGTPPERSMYETLLKGSRLHRKQGGGVGFFPPDGKADPAVRDVWKAIERFLTETEGGRKSVEDLFAALRRPPFGVKDGILPVLLAAALVQAPAQVALYEEGSFIPRPNAAVFERLCRAPGKFEVQRFRVAGPRPEIFHQYAALVRQPDGAPDPDLLMLLKPLVRLAKCFEVGLIAKVESAYAVADPLGA